MAPAGDIRAPPGTCSSLFIVNKLISCLSDIVIFTWDRDSYLTHVVFPRHSADKIHAHIWSVPVFSTIS